MIKSIKMNCIYQYLLKKASQIKIILQKMSEEFNRLHKKSIYTTVQKFMVNNIFFERKYFYSDELN